MTGAARLAARSAQRAGAGLVTIGCASTVWRLYAESLESVIVRSADDLPAWNALLADPRRNALVMGPGMGLGQLEKEFILTGLEQRKLTVLDADALTNFADRPETLFTHLHAACVLTPHEGEFARLFPMIDTTLDKKDRALRAAEMTGSVVLIKGHETIVAAPDGRRLDNDNAPAWLATAGAGDVLAGLIAGLMAQGMPPMDAAGAGCWMHGEAARLFGPGLIAEDLVSTLPAVVAALWAQKKA